MRIPNGIPLIQNKHQGGKERRFVNVMTNDSCSPPTPLTPGLRYPEFRISTNRNLVGHIHGGRTESTSTRGSGRTMHILERHPELQALNHL